MINRKVILGAVLVTGICLLYIFLLLNGLSFRQQQDNVPRAGLTVIAMGDIPTVDTNLLQVTPTHTALPYIEINGISVGKYAKIEGTEGVGLRIRREPGIETEVVFLSNESEVFTVVGGPIEKDGIIWWQLSAPYDETRTGWASGDFLFPLEEGNQP